MKWQLFFQIISLMCFAALLVLAVAESLKGKR